MGAPGFERKHLPSDFVRRNRANRRNSGDLPKKLETAFGSNIKRETKDVARSLPEASVVPHIRLRNDRMGVCYHCTIDPDFGLFCLLALA
jgi:hypothetical protein